MSNPLPKEGPQYEKFREKQFQSNDLEPGERLAAKPRCVRLPTWVEDHIGDRPDAAAWVRAALRNAVREEQYRSSDSGDRHAGSSDTGNS